MYIILYFYKSLKTNYLKLSNATVCKIQANLCIA